MNRPRPPKGFARPASPPGRGRGSAAAFARAVAHQRGGQLLPAAAAYLEVLAQEPDHGGALHGLGTTTYLLGDPFNAEAPLSRLLALKPDCAATEGALGLVLLAQGRAAEAQNHFRRSLALAPDGLEALTGLGNALLEAGEPLQAEGYLRGAVALAPSGAGAALNSLGLGLVELGRFDEALAAYREAVRCEPHLAEAHFNQGLVHLLRGDLAAGWPLYEQRWHTGGDRPRPFEGPAWDGGPLAGRRILLHAEQGFGDTFQFVRYAPLIQARGATVILACRAAERRLLASCPGIDRLLGPGESLPPFDLHAPLLSLPGLLGTQLTTVPAAVPYLGPPAATSLPAHLQHRLAQPGGWKVGLVWSASRLRYSDRKRGCPLAVLSALFTLEGLDWFSLLKGPAIADLESYGERLTDLGSHCADFADTAWVIARLDLVITVDTAVAHLAGALGKPVWVLLPRVPDWRWLLERQDSPWYPTARLFRQERAGEWAGVVAKLATALIEQFGAVPPVGAVSPPAEPEADLGGEIVLERALHQALCHFEAERLAPARAILQWLLRRRPHNVEALHQLGLVLTWQGDPAAVDLLHRAAALRPEDASLRHHLALALQAFARLAEALGACSQAVVLDPEAAEFWNTLGNLQAQQDQLRAAETSYRRALALGPHFAGTHNNLGIVLERQGHPDLARACYKQALVLRPDLTDAHQNLAALLEATEPPP